VGYSGGVATARVEVSVMDTRAMRIALDALARIADLPTWSDPAQAIVIADATLARLQAMMIMEDE
jgi:hypothetical protein